VKQVAERPDEPEERAREIERNTPPEQQEFDPAFAGSDAAS
jgi:hypothetical protein